MIVADIAEAAVALVLGLRRSRIYKLRRKLDRAERNVSKWHARLSRNATRRRVQMYHYWCLRVCDLQASIDDVKLGR